MLTVHAYIEVSEPKQGLAFYCDGLGLTLKRRLSPRWFELEGANLPIFLLANRPAVADLGTTTASTVARLLALGGALDRSIGMREYGRIANMADPFGNGFDLIEFSGPGYDNVSRPT